MAYPIGLPFGPVLAYPWPTFWPCVGISVGVPLADAINNILTDPYGSVAKWLSRKAVAQEIGVRSQMSVVSRMLIFIGVFSNLMLVLQTMMIWTSNNKSICK